ncbi:DUF4430 domain-containing protein [Thermodesulfitimonas sp.]
MRRVLTYLIAVAVILLGTLGPAFYLHKVLPPHPPPKTLAERVARAPAARSPGEGSGQTKKAAPAADRLTKAGKQTGQRAAGAPAPVAKTAALGNAAKIESKPAASGSSAAAPAVPAGCQVGIAVVGKNGELLFGPATVTVKPDNRWGVTALGALDATGLSYAMKPTWPDFVDAIAGQANSGMAGWMYAVNGEVPMHMADKHPVKTGDRVIWWYSRSMSQPPPRWEDLARQK